MSTELQPAKRTGKSYTLEDIEAGLTMVALCAGRPEAASKNLAAQGRKISKQTLHVWATRSHTEQYERIQNDVSQQISQRIAAQSEAFMLRAGEIELQALELTAEALPQMKPADRASALRNITTAKALNNDKIASPLRGRPSSITEHRDPTQILTALAHKLGYVDGTARELQTTEQATDGVVVRQPKT